MLLITSVSYQQYITRKIKIYFINHFYEGKCQYLISII
jgi:hypothetical protein